MLIGSACGASVLSGPNLAVTGIIPPLDVGAGICEWDAVAFVGGESDQPLTIFNGGDIGYLRRWNKLDEQSHLLELPNGFGSSGVANLEGDGDYVMMSDAGDGRLVWGWTDQTPACIAQLPFVGVLSYAIGDRDGDGRQEVVTISGAGGIRLWMVL